MDSSNNNQNNQVNLEEIKNTNSLAIIGFVLSFFVPIAGLVVSILGLKKAKEMNDSNKGFAIAGIIISSIFVGFALIGVLLFFFIFMGTYRVIETVVDKIPENDYDRDYFLCAKAYSCEPDGYGMYSCKYEDDYGEEQEIKCELNEINEENIELDLNEAISGEWVPFLVEKNDEEIDVSDYYGDDYYRFIRFSSDFNTFTETLTDSTNGYGTYLIVDKQITLYYNDGSEKVIDIDVFGDNYINLRLHDGDNLILLSR